jgi:hypothetical protein
VISLPAEYLYFALKSSDWPFGIKYLQYLLSFKSYLITMVIFINIIDYEDRIKYTILALENIKSKLISTTVQFHNVLRATLSY